MKKKPLKKVNSMKVNYEKAIEENNEFEIKVDGQRHNKQKIT